MTKPTKLSSADVETRLAGLTGWCRQGEAIVKHYTHGSFPEAIAFVTRMAFGAEAADHHPDILVSYKRVTLTYSTHSVGGITEKDFEGAMLADACL